MSEQTEIKVHPVQRSNMLLREPHVAPQVVTLRAYEVYCEVFRPQDALVTGGCYRRRERNEMNDTELLDALEASIKTRGYVFIHDLTGSDDPKWPQNYKGGGIGLMGWSNRPRSIRDVLEAALKPRNGK